jgi:hypothetical protein
MMDGSLLLEMAVPRKKAEQQVSGLEWPMNLHLVKLLGLRAPDATRDAWKRELREWCGEIATLRIKPANRTLPAATLMTWLHDERFEGSEVQNVSAMLALQDDFARNDASPEEVARRLHDFHAEASRRLSTGQVPLGLIAEL